MQTSTFIEGKSNKTFLLIMTEKGTYKVETIVCTDAEIEDGLLEEYGINDDELYPYLTIGGSSYLEYHITSMEIGDIVELECGEKLVRLA